MSIKIPTIDIPTDPRGRGAWVACALRLRGSSLSALARAEGVTASALSHVMTKPNRHLEAVIARAIGLTPQQVWPERFDADGERRHRHRPQYRKRVERRSNGKGGGAD